MSEEPRRLTTQDPVDQQTLKELDILDLSRIEVGSQLLTLEQERVRLIIAGDKIDQQRMRIFEKILIERGLDPKTMVSIDSKTGEIQVKSDTAPAQEA